MLAKIVWLPDSGPFAASRAGGRHHYGWDVDRYFLRSLLDNARKHLWVAVRAQQQRKGARRIPQPDDVPGPDELLAQASEQQQRPTKAVVTVAQLAAHLPP